ncbi:hypothetical protein F4804DRAFT_77437 [Jackrogersella minutella]|nr:hypothetical protein F4804DRAFT_77437 [Jackrogersella minutella]
MSSNTSRTGGKRGPKPFPGTRRKRCDLRVPAFQPIREHPKQYSRKRRSEVLLWLIHHRVADSRKNDFGEPPAPRLKPGQTPLSNEEHREIRMCKSSIIYRPPTFKEAEEFWKIQSTTIRLWWLSKGKYISPAEVENARLYRCQPSLDSTFKQTLGVAQNSFQPPALQSTSNAAAQLPPSDVQPQPSVVEISDDSDSHPGGYNSDDDEDLPDVETVISNAHGMDDQIMSKEIQGLQRIFDDSDTDIALAANQAASIDQTDEDSNENRDSEGSGDLELFGSI